MDFLIITDGFPNLLVNKLSDYKLNQTNPFYISSIKQ